jgi:hypothetical protein
MPRSRGVTNLQVRVFSHGSEHLANFLEVDATTRTWFLARDGITPLGRSAAQRMLTSLTNQGMAASQPKAFEDVLVQNLVSAHLAFVDALVRHPNTTVEGATTEATTEETTEEDEDVSIMLDAGTSDYWMHKISRETSFKTLIDWASSKCGHMGCHMSFYCRDIKFRGAHVKLTSDASLRRVLDTMKKGETLKISAHLIRCIPGCNERRLEDMDARAKNTMVAEKVRENAAEAIKFIIKKKLQKQPFAAAAVEECNRVRVSITFGHSNETEECYIPRNCTLFGLFNSAGEAHGLKSCILDLYCRNRFSRRRQIDSDATLRKIIDQLKEGEALKLFVPLLGCALSRHDPAHVIAEESNVAEKSNLKKRPHKDDALADKATKKSKRAHCTRKVGR